MQGRAATVCLFGSVAGAESDQHLLRCVVCGHLLIFDSTFFFFLFFFPFSIHALGFCLGLLQPLNPRHLAQTPGADTSAKSPTLLSHTPRLLLCPRQTPCAQHPSLLRGSTRPVPRTLTEAHTSRRRVALRRTPQNVERQGQREAVSGHGIP